MPTMFRVERPEELDVVVDPIVEWVANRVADDTERDTPVRTGTLRGGWQVQRNRTGEWRVANEVPYSVFVEFGNGNPGTAVGMLGSAVASARSRYGAR